jgi:hypothetical protein
MENIIKGIHMANGLTPSKLIKMEQAALVMAREHNLNFKLLMHSDKQVKIEVNQVKGAAEIYDTKKLTTIVHETFDGFFPGRKVIVHPITYKETPVDKVTPEWIRNKMTENGIKLKEITDDTGLNKSYLSGIINESKELSQVMKAMFYFYFLSRMNTKKPR